VKPKHKVIILITIAVVTVAVLVYLNFQNVREPATGSTPSMSEAPGLVLGSSGNNKSGQVRL
jgi:hypothetical protein